MARVFFEFEYAFDVPPAVVWDALVDWKGHEDWIFATYVELHTPGDPATVGVEFTAWSGPFPTTALGQRLSLEDRMQVTELEFDAATQTGTCRVAKLGPTLGGWAGFTVAPAETGSGTRLSWTENVTVRLLPGFLSPLTERVGVMGFRFFMRRLARQLRTPAAVSSV